MADFGDLAFMQRGRRFVVGVVMLGLGGVIGFALPKSSAAPRVETGTITSVNNATQNAGIHFAVKVKKVDQPEQFWWRDATPWRDKTGQWHREGRPACLIPGSTAAVKVTVGLVDVAAANSAPGGTVVVWLKCYR
ncbi:MAG: hypothetical protein LBV34_15385 [Nocardiopsaceae bacterium]|jgi:hypothetical protein|nr:hypothetical protein [Nocardiopsaceae bacterium]